MWTFVGKKGGKYESSTTWEMILSSFWGENEGRKLQSILNTLYEHQVTNSKLLCSWG